MIPEIEANKNPTNAEPKINLNEKHFLFPIILQSLNFYQKQYLVNFLAKMNQLYN